MRVSFVPLRGGEVDVAIPMISESGVKNLARRMPAYAGMTNQKPMGSGVMLVSFVSSPRRRGSRPHKNFSAKNLARWIATGFGLAMTRGVR
jgi:hypothetical protein